MATPIQMVGWLPVLLTSRDRECGDDLDDPRVVTVARPRGAEVLLATAGPPSNRGVSRPPRRGLVDIVGFVAFAIGLEVAPTWIVGLASSFGPVVAVIVAVVLWGERLRPTQWVGLAGIALGLVAVALP